MPPSRRILCLSRWWPEPADNGARLRAAAHLRALAGAGHRLTLIAFAEGARGVAAKTELGRWCEEIEAIPRRDYDPASWRARAGYLSPRPRSLIDVYSPAMQAAVRRAAPSHDLIIASSIEMAEYARGFADRPAILEELELGVQAQQRSRGTALARRRAGLGWRKLERHLARVLPRFAICTVASEIEAQLVRSIVPWYDGVRVLPNAVEMDPDSPPPDERTECRLVFAGSSTYAPNREGITWFVERVLPNVRRALPAVELLLTGAGEVPAAAGVRSLGWVEDVRGVVASAAVSIAPIRTGGGTRLKILEAMAVGTPVVSTSKGAEGLPVVHGEHLLIADDEEVFAAQVLRLLDDASLRRRLAANARELVRRHHDAARVGHRLVELVEEALGRAGAA